MSAERCCTICQNVFPLDEFISKGKNKKPRSICGSCSTVVAYINTKRKLGEDGMKKLIEKHTDSIEKMVLIMGNPSQSSFEVAKMILGTSNIPEV